MPYRDLTDWDCLLLFELEDQERAMRQLREESSRLKDEEIYSDLTGTGGIREPYSEDRYRILPGCLTVDSDL